MELTIPEYFAIHTLQAVTERYLINQQIYANAAFVG
jgi:hypothetical protein